MVNANNKTNRIIKLDETILEQVENYNYLGSIIEENGKINRKIDERLRRTGIV